jgi:hypothetical protein
VPEAGAPPVFFPIGGPVGKILASAADRIAAAAFRSSPGFVHGPRVNHRQDDDDDESVPAYRRKYFTATTKSFGQGAMIVSIAPVSGCSMVNCSR